MNIRNLRATTALFTGLAIVAVACGGNSEQDAVQTTIPATSPASGDSLPSIEPRTIAIFATQGQAEVQQRVIDSTKAAIAAVGWTSQFADGEGDPAKIQQRCEAMINAKPDAMLVIFAVPVLQTACFEAAQAADIPVLNVGLPAEETPLLAGQFGGDQRALAADLAAVMAKDLKKGDKIVAINLLQFFAAAERFAGLEEAQKANGWDVVGTYDVDLTILFEGTTKAGVDNLNAHPDLKAFWSCCDFGGAALLPAVEQSGRNVHTYSFYAISQVLPAVRTGNVTVAEEDNVKTGPMAIDALLKFFVDGTPIDSAAALAENPIQHIIVTKDNVPAEGQEVFSSKEALNHYLRLWQTRYNIKG